jgi:hypothetical protein
MLVATLALLAGCPVADTADDPLDDWSQYYPNYDSDSDADTDVDTDDTDDTDLDTNDIDNPEIPEGSFGIRVPQGLTYDMRLRKMDAAGVPMDDTPCAIEESEFGTDPSIQCMLDMDELDLHALELQFDVVVPPEMCDYLFQSLYRYESWKMGSGPASVEYTIDANGNFIREVNSRNGVAFCPYDYSWFDVDWPNCCEGTFTETITLEETGEVQTFNLNWGGERAFCYDGAAFHDKEAVFDSESWPLDQYTYLNRAGIEKHYQFESILPLHHTNVALANYYDPADHDGAMPAALSAEAGSAYAQPFYSFQCRDNADEVYARIDLVVREWNTKDDFYADGDPDLTGFEDGWDNEPLDDWMDWDAFTPDAVTWPMGSD